MHDIKHCHALMSRTGHLVSPFVSPLSSSSNLMGQHFSNCGLSGWSTFLRSSWELVKHADSWDTLNQNLWGKEAGMYF